jgi:hypothetical protein
MINFRIIAQSYTTSQRIARVVAAVSQQAAIKSVYAELENAGYYPLYAEKA